MVVKVQNEFQIRANPVRPFELTQLELEHLADLRSLALRRPLFTDALAEATHRNDVALQSGDHTDAVLREAVQFLYALPAFLTSDLSDAEALIVSSFARSAGHATRDLGLRRQGLQVAQLGLWASLSARSAAQRNERRRLHDIASVAAYKLGDLDAAEGHLARASELASTAYASARVAATRASLMHQPERALVELNGRAIDAIAIDHSPSLAADVVRLRVRAAIRIGTPTMRKLAEDDLTRAAVIGSAETRPERYVQRFHELETELLVLLTDSGRQISWRQIDQRFNELRNTLQRIGGGRQERMRNLENLARMRMLHG